jgi:hypothetical protein
VTLKVNKMSLKQRHLDGVAILKACRMGIGTADTYTKE